MGDLRISQVVTEAAESTTPDERFSQVVTEALENIGAAPSERFSHVVVETLTPNGPALTGVSGSGSVGTVVASGAGAVALTGVSSTGSVGTVTAVVGASAALTGVTATTSVGTVVPSTTAASTGTGGTGNTGIVNGPTITLDKSETCCGERVDAPAGETSPGESPGPDQFTIFIPPTAQCDGGGTVPLVADPTDSEAWT